MCSRYYRLKRDTLRAQEEDAALEKNHGLIGKDTEADPKS